MAVGLVAEELLEALEEPSEPERKVAAGGPHRFPLGAGAAPWAERCKRRPAMETTPGASCTPARQRTAAVEALERQPRKGKPAAVATQDWR
jgi:hypothetical protein